MIYRQTFTTRLSVAIINDRSAGASSSALLESDLREYLGCGKKDLIEINEGLMVDFNEESTSQYGYATLAKISALAASESLDVVIGDQSAIDHYETISAYQNLEELLSPELYARVKDHIYRAKDGEGNLTPVALSLEDTALGEKTGIIMDPPSYGRGPKGEIWKIEDAIFPLVKLCAGLLSEKPLFFLINSYTTGLAPAVLTYMLGCTVKPRFGGTVRSDEIGLPVSSTGLVLPCGASGRWEA